MFGHETVEINFCRYKNGKHGNRGKRKHGNGKGSDLFEEHGPQCKRGVNHLPPHLREEKMKENKKKKRKSRGRDHEESAYQ